MTTRSERICIKCGQRLTPRMLDQVEVDCCPGCKGLWLDRGEIRQLGARFEAGALEPREEARPAPYRAPEPPAWRARSPLEVPCPACGGKLSQADFDTFVIEHCTACEGIFLDPGELEKAMVAVDARGNKAATIVALARSVFTTGSIGG